MKVAIVNNCAPFIYGGAEFLADSLKDKIIEHGHQATVIKIPFSWNPPQKVLDHILACRLLRLENVDKVIALKFPAYYIKHSNKVLWLLHQYRQAYDLWGTPYQDIPSTPEGLRIRQTVINSDNNFLGEARRIYTNSKVTKDRLARFNGITAEVLYPPLIEPDKYYHHEYGDYIFYPSRINKGKRQYLAIESMRHVKSPVTLVIAGNPDSPEELTYIQSIVAKNHLEHRVKIMGRWITQDEKAKLFANCLACTYLPYDEDSYGYVSLEAYQSRKPVITCTDSGGTLELVENESTGFVIGPQPEALAKAMDSLYCNKTLAAELGNNGNKKMVEMGITWKNVLSKLLS